MSTFSTLIELIYAAIPDRSGWPKFLEAFVRAVGGKRASLAIRDSRADEFGFVCWHGWPDEDIRIYAEHFSSSDPWHLASPGLPESYVAFSSELVPQEEMEASAAFREFYAPRDVYYGMGGSILRSATGHSLISVARGNTAGPFQEKELAVLRSLMPHLKRAAVLHGEFCSLRSQVSAFTGHLNRYPYGFLLVDSERRVLYANPAAWKIVERRDGLRVEGGRLLASSKREDDSLNQATRVMVTDSAVSLHRLAISRSSGLLPWRLIVMTLADSQAMPLGIAQPGVAILIVDPENAPDTETAVLTEMFSLTPAEARVTSLLAKGRSVEEIAAETRVSIETTRTHVRRVLQKTGTSRQGELIALVLRSAPVTQV
jgi:DNA-binding CsgD family transcriptional regulator